MNLWKCLEQEFFDNYDFWNYFQSDMVNPFVNEEAARQFIVDYFKSACKGQITYEWERFEKNDLRFRDTHTIYVFFIGAMLQYMIDPDLKIISNGSVYGEDYKFSYLWFLTCLAHDLGYIYESKYSTQEIVRIKNLCNRWCENKCGRRICSMRNLAYRVISPSIRGVSSTIPSEKMLCYYKEARWTGRNSGNNCCEKKCAGSIQFSNGIEIKKNWHTNSLKEKYFKYRLFEMNVLDHGIVGGDKFFSDMVEIYYDNYENHLQCGDFESFRNTQYRTFSCEQFKIWAYVADCIASHNIFKEDPKRNVRELYEKYGLYELLHEKFSHISYEKNPLLFILSVADTLEPTKKIKCMKVKNIFENMNIEFNVEDKVINLYINKRLAKAKGYDGYIKGVKELIDWCEIEVNVNVEE